MGYKIIIYWTRVWIVLAVLVSIALVVLNIKNNVFRLSFDLKFLLLIPLGVAVFLAWKFYPEIKEGLRIKISPIAIGTIAVVIVMIGVLLLLPGKDERPVEVRLQEYLMKKVPRNATVAIEGLDDATLSKIERPIVWLANYTPSEEAIPLNVTIRGSHKMWVYLAEGEDLEINLSKQDLNWYNGTDVLRVEVYNPNLKLVYTGEIEDDGDNSTSKKMGPVQPLNVVVKNDGQGAYKVLIVSVARSDDMYISLDSTRQNKIVFEDRIFPISKTSLWFKCPVEECNLDFYIVHTSAKQNISIINDDFLEIVNIDDVRKHFTLELKYNNKVFKISPSNDNFDVFIEFHGYFSVQNIMAYYPNSIISKESPISPKKILQIKEGIISD